MDHNLSKLQAKYTEQAETKRLTGVGRAGHCTHAAQRTRTSYSRESSVYVGRYTTQISCEDKFVMCERGTVDLYSKPDRLMGQCVFAFFVNAGQISYDNKKQYGKDL